MPAALPTPTDCCQRCCEDATTIVPSATVAGIQAYDTKLELMAETVYVDRMFVSVLGGTVIGDGNGGLYYFDAASTAVADGASVLQPDDLTAAQAGRWIQFGV